MPRMPLEICDYSLDWMVGTAFTKLRRPEIAQLVHGIGATASSVSHNQWILLLYSQALGLSAVRVTEVQFVSTLIDIGLDWFISVASDGTRSRLGRRHPFLLLAIVPLVWSKSGIYHPPDKAAGEDAIWWHLFWCTMMGNLGSNLWSAHSLLTLELIPDYDERAKYSLRTTVAKMIFANGLSAFATGVLLRPSAPGANDGFFNLAGYRTYGTLAATLLFILSVVGSFGTVPMVPELTRPPPKKSFSWREAARQLSDTLGSVSCKREPTRRGARTLC